MYIYIIFQENAMLLSDKRKCDAELRQKMGVLKAYEVFIYVIAYWLYHCAYMLCRILSNSIQPKSVS